MTLLSPWRDFDPTERRAQLRALQAIARILAGSTAAGLIAALRRAEADTAALPAVDEALDALLAISKRRILATFAQTLPRSGR